MKYLINCVSCKDVEALHEMIDNSREITWKTFKKYVKPPHVEEIFPDYSYRGERDKPGACDFHIKDDYAVSFHKSKFKGQPCVYIVHSAIEYIFC